MFEFVQDMENLVELRPYLVAVNLGLLEQGLERRRLEFKKVGNLFDEEGMERNNHNEAIGAWLISVKKMERDFADSRDS